MKDIKIKVMKSSLNNYIIKRSNHGFFCEVKTRNILKLIKEYYNDTIGITYKHPQFLTNRYFSSLEAMENRIQVSIKIDDEKTIIPINQKLCSFCATPLTKEDLENPNDYYLSCYQHKEFAQIVTEKHFRENPDYTQWNK